MIYIMEEKIININIKKIIIKMKILFFVIYLYKRFKDFGWYMFYALKKSIFPYFVNITYKFLLN